MIFIETSTFTKILPSYLSDDDYRGLQSYLLQKPDAGDLVRGSGKFVGLKQVKVKVAEYEQFTIGKSPNMKFGC
jgi:hypothetical protein